MGGDFEAFSLFGNLPGGFGQFAVAALAALEVRGRFEKMAAAEVRPEALSDVYLGIGDLPQQAAGKAHLARSSYEQVGIGHVGRVEMAVNIFLGDAVGACALELDFCGEGAKGVDKLRAAAVGKSEGEGGTCVAGCGFLCPAHLVLEIGRA